MWIVTPDMLESLRSPEAHGTAEPESPCLPAPPAPPVETGREPEASAPDLASDGASDGIGQPPPAEEPAQGADGEAGLRRRLAWAVLHMLEEFEAEGIEPPDSAVLFLREAGSWKRVDPPVDRMLTVHARARRKREAHLPKRHGAFLAPDEAPRGPPRMLNVLA